MLVIVVELVPPRLRGRLGVRFLEFRAGVYLGKAGQRLRERVWKELEAGVGDGNAVMAWTAPREQGFRVRTLGRNRRDVVDWDGLTLAAFHPDPEPGPSPAPTTNPSVADIKR